ncbi:MAG: ABC transporter permease, partial [Pusillimonas sp.]|nr:ABC transporter permease [Pusillimonas sp.]
MTQTMIGWGRLCLSPLFVLVIWEVVCRAGFIEPQLLPAPSSIAFRLVEQASAPAFWENFSITLYRLAVGLIVAVFLGVVLGLAAQLSRFSAVLLDSLVRLLAPIPKIALYPALILI